MANKKAIVITTSILVIGGIGGYLLWDHLKKPSSEGSDTNADEGANTDVDSSSGSSSGSSSSPQPPSRSELATAYRAWANSTTALSKKYGKKSSFNLDATGSANSYFDKSYAVGKADYEAYLKSQQELKYADLPNNLKGVATALGFQSKGGSFFKQNSAGNFYIVYSNNKGQTIYIFDNGNYRVLPKGKSSPKLSAGSFASNLTSITPFSGYPKAGQKITNSNPHTLFALASETLEQQYAPMTNSSATSIANNLYNAMDGVGTKDPELWSNLNKIKNPNQFRQVYTAFGTREGEYLDDWLSDDLELGWERKKFNDYTTSINSRMKLSTSGQMKVSVGPYKIIGGPTSGPQSRADLNNWLAGA